LHVFLGADGEVRKPTAIGAGILQRLKDRRIWVRIKQQMTISRLLALGGWGQSTGPAKSQVEIPADSRHASSHYLVRRALPPPILLFALALSAAGNGCALHYTNLRAGTEHLWGIGQLGIKTEKVGDAHLAVTTSFRVLGLCLEVGRDSCGLTLGSSSRQQLMLLQTNSFTGAVPFEGSRALSLQTNPNQVWGLGHLRLHYPCPLNSCAAVISGRALGGVQVRVGPDAGGLTLGLDTRQLCRVANGTGELVIDQDAPNWPGFDLFTAKVQLTAQQTSNLSRAKERP
jgi:hypothetical protein